MNVEQLFDRYRELQSYVGWTDADAERIVAAAPLLEPSLLPLIDDFYAEIERHPDARKVITGGPAQIERLKGTLVQMDPRPPGRDVRCRLRRPPLASRLAARRDRPRAGLHQRRPVAAADRPDPRRSTRAGRASRRTLKETVRALNKLLDLDLAIIEDAYQAEYMARLQRSERLATLGQVAGGVAHELRNPLNVVKTSVYYLLNARNPTPEKKAEHLRRIERNVELADGVITALSNFARMPVPNLRPIAVEPCVREALEINPPGDGIEVVDRLPARAALRPGRRRPAPDRAGQPDPQRPRRHAAGRAADDRGARESTGASRCRSPTPGSGSSRRTWPGSWSRSTRPRPAGWAWGLQSRGRSWKRTRVCSAWPASRAAAASSRSD